MGDIQPFGICLRALVPGTGLNAQGRTASCEELPTARRGRTSWSSPRCVADIELAA